MKPTIGIKIRSVNDAGIAIDYLANRGYRLLASKDAYLRIILKNSNIKMVVGTNYGISLSVGYIVENYIDLTNRVLKTRATIF